jgi:hypothetical protein
MIFWVSIKLFIAYLLIQNLDYGIYIVLAYLIFQLESHTGLHFINTQESNTHFNNIYNKLKYSNPEHLKQEIKTLKGELGHLTSRLETIEASELFDNDYND